MVKSLLIILTCWLPIAAQSRNELHQKFGNPISETYEVRQGIYVTATYNKQGDVCQLVISPQLATETLNYPSTKTIKSDTLAEIIGELVPLERRGKQAMGGFSNITCLPLNNCFGAMHNYERVQIFRNGGTDKEQ